MQRPAFEVGAPGRPKSVPSARQGPSRSRTLRPHVLPGTVQGQPVRDSRRSRSRIWSSAPLGASQRRAARLGDRLEHPLQVGRRRRDHPQHLGGRGLLIERARKLRVALLQLREQPGVLDGDDRLIRERLQQGDLLVRERAKLVPAGVIARSRPPRGAVGSPVPTVCRAVERAARSADTRHPERPGHPAHERRSGR